MAKSDKKRGASFLNGVPNLLILKLLSRREMYGYELVRSIQQASGEALVFAEGCIYPLLHVLEEEGCISSREQAINGRTRLYYLLTGKGEQRLAEMEREWDRVRQGVVQALNWEPVS
ncbi:PadR family transcriptional regulator [Geomesophilobacter sediminis]|uniref:Helix-turn-helix transcriptional regulator n=1 Tax=Geomesophilobacter sediminis TaxID=2798584 RepID=A0A8J7INQ6_9BACT|nr:PadR family transcriptional regulator [Geomesophilobacter sediminis]MBJ6724938.1 helix-turn-helix transcriptional regulator [Geomesophilobacter sediminis]